MSPSNEQVLIDYLDNRLEGEERQAAEQLLREDAAAAQELDSLLLSVELIRESAVLDQVAAVRADFNAGAKIVPMQKKEGGAVVRSFSKNVFRIAVMVVLLLGAASVYKYSVTSSSSVYDQHFVSFDLSTNRGNNNEGALETAYRSKNWGAVENIAAAEQEKTAKTWFLAGMAEMELKAFDKAIQSFNAVMDANRNNAAPYFQDEAEYYLAMAYLGDKKPAEAVAILKKIRSDKNHLFNRKAAEISALDLTILEQKTPSTTNHR